MPYYQTKTGLEYEPNQERRALILVGSQYALLDLIHEMVAEGSITPTEGWGYGENLRAYKACIEPTFRMAWDRLTAFSQDAHLSEAEQDWLLQHWRKKD